ncbi:GNAT family N-acetyltransferase [Allofranklinella schreckenbergeri]|uniref:GNAT family N-acetyltransferase n=1 Tax=Allofranklinella schreckenbergeri TaxID=1076744 RepID=A0A3M6QE10_9BURK|nr:GNAT family N-acetyltransferase [Allofranklinella schreckenbergeri]RMW99342.1 GNAT family N-acetyltransferase [Allofranklinella schreckenbergeri]RMX01366.1 GNAT family N-acetyltransferase [Allofranklinella schreckenbergeri]
MPEVKTPTPTTNSSAPASAKQAAAPAPAQTTPAATLKEKPQPLHIPIRSLGPVHRPQILEHLLNLSDRDRYLRFGYPASNTQVERYVENLDFQRDEIYGIHNRKLELIAMAHLAFDPPAEGKPRAAEFGVSVSGAYRGRHLGKRLYDRAMMHARNEGAEIMYIHALSENAPMLKIARNAGAVVQREGGESEAYLRLPPANLNSRLTEVFEDQFGEMDYRMKVQAYQFQAFLDGLQRWSDPARLGKKKEDEAPDQNP